jgi:uncharacterized membrane protein YphA (DoxX/SURF4 family)
MTRLLLDLAWWLMDRGWQFARAWSGDDAYERYLAARSQGGEPLSRAAYFDAYLEHKWGRYSACGRFSRPD